MIRRKRAGAPPDDRGGDTRAPPAPPPPAPDPIAAELRDALVDILRCNTARKCHDRARLALVATEDGR